ncbi:MAG: hypothetical protein JXB32_26000 [Deltaproteobacteria bacterium]|nr:hypothetical protein [Deltaproteobacteria bacterium]
MATSTTTAERQPVGTAAGGEGDAIRRSADVETSESATSSEDRPEQTPTIEGLLTLRPESLTRLDEMLSVLDSIRLFRALVDEASDRIKVVINREEGATTYFTHGCGFLAGLQETDERLAALEQAVRAVRVGTDVARLRAVHASGVAAGSRRPAGRRRPTPAMHQQPVAKPLADAQGPAEPPASQRPVSGTSGPAAT